MRKVLCPILLSVCFWSCKDAVPKKTDWVDPFLGTGGHGHVYPGATVPFGMVQLSPDNGVEGWDWSSGYHYSSKTIAGFSHTHLSGTGIGDWCDISVLPLTDTQNIRSEKILIPFDHAQEKARPGFYQVKLDNEIQVELTATERTGYHRYQFPTEEAWLRFDMGFSINWDDSKDGYLRVIDDSTIVGHRFSEGWAKGQKVYFAARFSSPIQQHLFLNDTASSNGEGWGKEVKLALQFKPKEQLQFKVSLSSVSTEKALKELALQNGLTFDQVVESADQLWEAELNKIQIESDDPEVMTKFYTSLYRTCMAPVLYSDADGSFQTASGEFGNSSTYGNRYTIFSQWDVFRALNPLFTLTQPKRVPEMINSMLQFYEENGLLPVWDISTWEANTMTGYHSVPIIADAMLKGISGFDYQKAYAAMKASAEQNQRGSEAYRKYQYVPQSLHGWSVTITLEYAFDDWCIAQVAKKLGKMDDYKIFMERSNYYKNLFDPTTGFMRGKDTAGKFIEPFDPLWSEHGFDGQYIEGTAWQHSFFVPHDVTGLAALYGGQAQLIKKLDELFEAPSELHGENTSADVSGLIGQYAHGNEPSHHIIYLYTLLGKPEKTAKWLRVVADSMYKTGPDGLVGNDDCGQMSAWYVWSALGLYPVNPASGEYVFGVPFINKATIKLPNNKELIIRVKRNSNTKEEYLQKAIWNGKPVEITSISHTELLKGGTLELGLGR
jgi:predicted alpha-1,2-mannosidase